jgi:PAS domain-containing protein
VDPFDRVDQAGDASADGETGPSDGTDRQAATDLADQVRSLSGEVAGLRRAMRTRGVIEQAKGMLAQRLGCSPEQAFGHLSRLSQEHNVRLAELAAKLVHRALPAPDEATDPPAPATAGQETEGYQRLERAGGLGWASWDIKGRPVLWSPGMYRLLRRDPSRGPVALNQLAGLRRWMESRDVAALERALRIPVESGEPAGVEVPLRRDGEVRILRLRTEPLRDSTGEPVGLFTIGQDVTGQRRPDPDQLRTERQLAAQRMRMASDLRRMEEISLAAPAELTTALPGLRVLARHLAPDNTGHLRGDFYQAVPLPDGSVLLAVGDGFGSGAQNAGAMVRLCAELRGLAIGGVTPARLLTLLNADLAGQSGEPVLASALVVRYEPAKRTVTWAQAGHPAPVLVRAGAAGMPPRPPGVLLGLMPDSNYTESRLLLRTDDVLVLYTDAVVNSRRTPDSDVQRQLLDLTGQAAPGGLSDVVTALNPVDAREACILAAQVVEPGPDPPPAGADPPPVGTAGGGELSARQVPPAGGPD